MQHYGRAAALQGVDVLEGTIAAVDGEKDPRCLLLAFKAVATVAQLHCQPGMDAAALQQAAPELVDILACYFPVQYTEPAGVPGVVTRAELVSELHAAMASAPAFAEAVVPLLLEKLSSALERAKVDALGLLPQCCAGYGGEALQAHMGPVGGLHPAGRCCVVMHAVESVHLLDQCCSGMR